MNTRHRRLQQLKDQREKALAERVRSLDVARLELERAEAAERSAGEVRRAAEADRQEAAGRGVSVELWVSLNQWLQSSQAACELARRTTERAALGVERARAQVLSARTASKQVDLLRERILQREQGEERRREQGAQDEHAAGARTRSNAL